MSILTPGPETRVYQPGELNAEIRLHLEAGFPRLWLTGEISNLARPASGHWYFTIKDARAQIRCALFRPRRNQIGVEPVNGDQVLVRGRVSLYEPRGDYQLIADTMLPAGSGALQQAFAALKEKLENEGLFAVERKQPLPAFPERIAIVTSPTGAAIRDMLVTLKRRWPVAEIRIYSTPVQGDQAVPGLIRALQAADRHASSDVILLARGGGSMEDLQAFNDETLARVIVDIETPVVCGVGHEHDVSIADWVADVRAATPTAAAEAATPDGSALHMQLEVLGSRMIRSQQQQMQRRWQHLDSIERRRLMQHPVRRLSGHQQQSDQLQLRMQHAWNRRLMQSRQALQTRMLRLQNCHPARAVREAKQRHADLERRLRLSIHQCIQPSAQKLSETARALNTVSPLSVLGRGYALIEDKTGHVLTRKQDFSSGQTIHARFSGFTIQAEVTDIQPEARFEARPANDE